jgi:hypothetical protein
MLQRMLVVCLLILAGLIITGSASAQAPQTCQAAETYWNTSQNAFYYHCPGGNAYIRITTISGGGGGVGLVTSVFGRTGDVIAQSGDYSASQITNAFNLTASNNLGSNWYDIGQIAVPANPSSGFARVFYSTATGLLSCINSSGASCMPSSGGGAVSSVFGRTGAVTAQSGDYNFAQILGTLNLGTQVSGNLSTSNLNNGTGASATTFWRGDGTWAPAGVSSFSAGNLSPIFTTSVATPTSTPALSFTLSNAGAHQFLGNNTGGSGAPAYVQPAFTDIGGTCQISQGCTGQTSANAALNALLPTQTSNAGKLLQTDGTNTSWQPGLVNPMTTLGDMLYENASPAIARLPGPTTPNSVPELLTSTPSGGIAQAPTWLLPGVSIDTQSSSTPTIAATDRVSLVNTSNNTTSTASSIASAATFGNNYAFVTCNTGSVINTITPTTSSVNSNLTLKLQGQVSGNNPECAFWWSDPIANAYFSAEILPTDANGRLQAAGFPAETGDVTNSAGSLVTTIANNAVNSTKMAVVNTRRVCDIAVGDQSGASAISNAQLGPQKRICYIPAGATVVELDVAADAGTPNVIVGRSRAGVTSNLVSSALATAAAGGIACSNTGGTLGIDGATTCTNTLQNTGTNAGDYFELVSGTAGGTAKLMTIHVIYTIN